MVVKRVQFLILRSKYETKAIETALKGAFSDDQPLFGRRKDQSPLFTKTAVTGTTSTGDRGIIISNYNRRQRRLRKDVDFERPLYAKDEVLVWEA